MHITQNPEDIHSAAVISLLTNGFWLHPSGAACDDKEVDDVVLLLCNMSPLCLFVLLTSAPEYTEHCYINTTVNIIKI